MEITIVIPVYNRKTYIEATVQSILDSSTKIAQIILVDNGSTDGSYELCQALACKAPDKIIVAQEKKRGASAARNLGMDLCQTDWIYFFDSDDIFTHLPKVENEEEYDVISFPVRMVDSKTGKEKVRWFPKNGGEVEQILGCFISTHSAICRTSFLRANGIRWDEDVTVWDDWVFAAHMLFAEPNIWMLPKEVCHRVLQHDESLTGASFASNVEGKKGAIKKMFHYIQGEKNTKEAELWYKALYFHLHIVVGRMLHERDTEEIRNLLNNEMKSSLEKSTRKVDRIIAKLFLTLTKNGIPGIYRLAIMLCK